MHTNSSMYPSTFFVSNSVLCGFYSIWKTHKAIVSAQPYRRDNANKTIV